MICMTPEDEVIILHAEMHDTMILLTHSEHIYPDVCHTLRLGENRITPYLRLFRYHEGYEAITQDI